MSKQKQKRPALMFYSGDWLKERSLRMCSLAARGAWIDLLMLMHTDETDRITGTMLDFSRALGCSYDEANNAICELIAKGVCDVDGDPPAPGESVTCHADVTKRHSDITLISRRFLKERKSRDASRERQRRHREKG